MAESRLSQETGGVRLVGINNIRPTSFQYSHGPGSVLETSSGPVVVQSPDRLFEAYDGTTIRVRGEDETITISRFEIIEPRLSNELGGVRLVRLPSNEELGRPAMDQIYPTIPEFPMWCVCTRHEKLYRAWDDRRFRDCSDCRSERRNSGDGTETPSVQEIARDQPVRFVRACSNGHLSDIDWASVIHRGRDCPRNNDSWFFWNNAGGSIGEIRVSCMCGAWRNMGEVYSEDHECDGWHLHEGYQETEPCTEVSRVVQRGSAGLYLPEQVSALDISTLSRQTINALDDPAISERLRMLVEDGELEDRAKVRRRVEACQRSPLSLRLDLMERIDDDSQWPSLLDAMRDRIVGRGEERGIREQEFQVLVHSSRVGSPPPPINNPRDLTTSPLKVIANECFSFPTKMGATISVAPVKSLRVVNALTGFSRQIGEREPQTVPSIFEFQEARWAMAMETNTEGVFLHFEEGSVPVSADHPRASYWLRRYEEENDTSLHPQHVWWHTLSHLLIKHISLDSGFSSASIRERTYAIEGSDGSIAGGVLLFPSQQGGDGTLGGLSSLAKNQAAFSGIIDKCRSEVMTCSNDPLCEESSDISLGGAACFACCLTSETSCEHRNKSLDRLLLRESMP